MSKRKPVVVYPALSPTARKLLGKVLNTLAPVPTLVKDRT